MILSEISNPYKLIKASTGERSDIRLCGIISHPRLINSAIGDKSRILLLLNSMTCSFIKPARGDISDIKLLLHLTSCNSVAASSPVKSLMLALCASRCVNVAISSAVIRAFGALPSASAIAACRFASGMLTVCADAVGGNIKSSVAQSTSV